MADLNDYTNLRDALLGLQATIARLTAELEARDQQISDLLDTTVTCACGYDSPDDVCMKHMPMFKRLTAERDAIAAAAYERAAQWHDEVAAHDQSGIDYSDAVGIPISNREQLVESVKQHEYSAREIRSLATEAGTTALAEIVKKTVDAETWDMRKALEDLLKAHESGWPDKQDWGAGDRARATIARLDQRKEAGA